jgi:Protein of unknown function (DUF3102)
LAQRGMRSRLAGDGEWEGSVMTDTPKLTPEQLSKNAQLINAAHRQVVQANKTSIEKAIEAGEILRACKKSVGHGAWSKWLHDNCREISEETARLYMRLADPENAPKLEEAAKQNGNGVADLSVRGAAQVLREEPTEQQKAERKKKRTEKERAEAETRAVEDAARAAALIPKQLKHMDVNQVLNLLTHTFDDDYLDTLMEALRKHLKDEEPKAQATTGTAAGIAGIGRVLSPTPQAKPA